jgi:hypothetical protein
MKAKIIAVLGAVALGLTASASAQTTDYTPVSFNLTGTYLKGTVQPGYYTYAKTLRGGRMVVTATFHAGSTTYTPATVTVNNASILAKIGAFVNANLAADTLAVDDSSGDLCVISGTNLVYDLSSFPYAQFSTNNVNYTVQADSPTIDLADNATTIITGGTSGLTNSNFSVSGTVVLQGFSITFSDSDGTVYQVNIDGGLGTFTVSLTGTQTYTQTLNAQVFGTAYDYLNNVSGISITGTITAAGGPSSNVAVPSIWDVVNPFNFGT